MAKKSSFDLKKILTLVSVGLGIIAFIMIFLPALGIKDTDTTYTGLQAAFGYSETSKVLGSAVTTTYLQFSFMNLLTYAILIVGVVFAILAILGKGSKFASLIATICFIVSGIFFFMTVAFCVPADGITSLVSLLGKDVKEFLTLGAGAIIGGILAILAGVASGAKLLMK